MSDPSDHSTNESIVGIHRHLERLDDHVADLRQQVTDSRLETASRIGALEVAIASRGREPLPKGLWITAAMLGLAFVGQAGASFRWAGLIEARVDSHESSLMQMSAGMEKAVSLIDSHLQTAGPFRTGVERWQREQDEHAERLRKLELTVERNTTRLEGIERRNAVADRNWEKLNAKGLLVEKTKP